MLLVSEVVQFCQQLRGDSVGVFGGDEQLAFHFLREGRLKGLPALSHLKYYQPPAINHKSINKSHLQEKGTDVLGVCAKSKELFVVLSLYREKNTDSYMRLSIS
jgi:hypothetical protein